MANLSATMLRNNYVFFGTPSFAAIILEKLIGNDWVPKALVCNPDRPVGRRQIITPPPANKEALVGVSDELFTEADFGVLAAYGQIVPAEVIKKARLGIIGVHPSLLPKFRGSTPIQSAILEGVSETGVSLFLMDEKVDHGPILAQRKLLLDNLFSNSRELETRLLPCPKMKRRLVILKNLQSRMLIFLLKSSRRRQAARIKKKFLRSKGKLELLILNQASGPFDRLRAGQS